MELKQDVKMTNFDVFNCRLGFAFIYHQILRPICRQIYTELTVANNAMNTLLSPQTET